MTAETFVMSAGVPAAEWSQWSMRMRVLVTDPAALHGACWVVRAQLDAIEAAASRFRADSEVCAIARRGGQSTEVSALLADLIGEALRAARRTDGDVDPTVGAALNALGYDDDWNRKGQRRARAVPVVASARWSMVRLRGRTVTVPPNVVLDLGATAKAVAADRCADAIFAQTGSGVLVNLGGDLATAGPTPVGNWQVQVQDKGGQPSCSVGLPSGAAMATSSTISRTWRRGVEVVHHIVDPVTQRCAEPVWRTVTVAAGRCVDANTVSTAAVIRGRRALEWIAGLGLPARLVDQRGAVHVLGPWPAGDGHVDG